MHEQLRGGRQTLFRLRSDVDAKMQRASLYQFTVLQYERVGNETHSWPWEHVFNAEGASLSAALHISKYHFYIVKAA